MQLHIHQSKENRMETARQTLKKEKKEKKRQKTELNDQTYSKFCYTSDIKCIAICMTVVGSHIYVHLSIVSKGTAFSTVALIIM